MSVNLILYSTSHCHLCEQAETLLRDISAFEAIVWINVEIADDSRLLQRYEVKIPVLKRLDTESEIAWPFTTQDILSLINING